MSVKLHLGRAFYQGLEIKLISRAQIRADLCLLMTRLPAGMSAPRAVSPSSPLLLQQKPSRGPGGLFFVQPLCTSPQRWTWVDLDTSEVCCSARQVARGFPFCVDPKAPMSILAQPVVILPYTLTASIRDSAFVS